MRTIYRSLMGLVLAAAGATGWAAPTAPISDSADEAGVQFTTTKVAHSRDTDHRALALTIYQNGLALVHDSRQVTFSPASSRLTLADLPTQLQPDTVAVSLDAAAQVLRQQFRNNDWTVGKLLQAYQGDEVLLVPRAGQNGGTRRGMLVSAGGGNPIVRIGDRLEIGGPDAPWRIAFPSNSRVKVTGPELDLQLSTAIGGRHKLDLIYLTDGLGWQMDYWAELKGERLHLEGFAQISNHSGGRYSDAKVRLVAGDVARSDQVRPVMLKAQRAFAAEAATTVESALAWHLYHLDQPVNLPDDATLRLRLLSAKGLAVQRQYRVNGNATDTGGEAPVQVRLQVNTATANPPLALPAGTVRVRELGAGGEPRYLGADRIGHTPAGAPLELVLGTAFDVTAQRTRELYRHLGKDQYEVGWRIELHNARAQPVTVELREELPGDWEIVQQSAPHKRLSSTIAQWSVAVPATGAAVVSYRARYSR